MEQVPFAFKHYKRIGNDDVAEKYKKAFCRTVRIDFLGVWFVVSTACKMHMMMDADWPSCRDTVDSVGILWGRTLPFTAGNKAIRVFRHALALDEVSLTDYDASAVTYALIGSTSQAPHQVQTEPLPTSFLSLRARKQRKWGRRTALLAGYS